MSKRVPDLLVEQLQLGELSAAEASSVRKRLVAGRDPRLEDLATSDREILQDYPGARIGPQIQARLDALDSANNAQGNMGWLWIGGLATMAAGALAWWITGNPQVGVTPGASPAEQIARPSRDRVEDQDVAVPEMLAIKGDPKLVIKRVHGSRISDSLRSGTVQPGDTLRIAYTGSDAPHGVVLSIDAVGGVTQYFPSPQSRSTRLNPGQTILTDFTLDDAPGFERFFFVTCPAPIDVAQVLASAAALANSAHPRTGPLGLPAGCFADRLDTVVLDKPALSEGSETGPTRAHE